MSRDGSSCSAPAPATTTTTGGVPGGAPQLVEPSGRRSRWPWAIVLLALGAAKAHAFEEVSHHRPELIVVLGVAVAVSVLRIRLIMVAVSAAALFAVCLDPHPWLRGLAVGAGGLALLLAVFFTIATVLHVRQGRGSPG